MIHFQSLPKALRERMADPHDPLGRWAFVHPALTLCLPLPVYNISEKSASRPKNAGWSFTVTFCGAVIGSLETLGVKDSLTAHNGRLAAEAVHRRLEEVAKRTNGLTYQPALILDPSTRMRYIWLRSAGDEERFVPVLHEFRLMTRAEFEGDRTHRRAHSQNQAHWEVRPEVAG